MFHTESRINLVMKIIILLSLLTLARSSPEMERIKMKRYFEKMMKNWTSCEEFLQDSQFDMKAITDIDWKIFYFWNYVEEKSYVIRFSLATPGLIKRFKIELNKRLKPAVEWSRADVFMETSIDFSGLLIRTRTPGHYRLIPSIAFDYQNLPFTMIALKFVDPYLGLMNCTPKLCYALAPVDKFPVNETHIASAAASLGFRSSVGRSYLMKISHVTPSKKELKAFKEKEDVDDLQKLEKKNDVLK